MKILRLSYVFIILRLVTVIADMIEGLLNVSKNTSVGVTHVARKIMATNIKMNDAVNRNNYQDTTDSNLDVNRAIKDLGYYLRAHKFIDYDRRYYNNIKNVKRRLWEEFPKPPLRSLHWEVDKYCNDDFIECLKYLNSIVQQTSLKREDDTIFIIRKNKWTRSKDKEKIMIVDRECKTARERDNLTYAPFRGPIERFQWRTTASYYMCWYTMLGQPELSFFREDCDDYANCLTGHGENGDIRARDSDIFACALYSFCPDPCCTMKLIWDMKSCYRSPINPCQKSNHTAIRKCKLNRHENQNFYDLMKNHINISCECDEKGYEWSSRFGLCVDINECTRGLHNCLINTNEICINLPGDFECICRHGFIYSEEFDRCIENLIFTKIVVQTIRQHVDTTEPPSLLDKIVKLLTKSSANKCYHSTLLILLILLLLFNSIV